jgi:hypothetical protein
MWSEAVWVQLLKPTATKGVHVTKEALKINAKVSFIGGTSRFQTSSDDTLFFIHFRPIGSCEPGPPGVIATATIICERLHPSEGVTQKGLYQYHFF